MRGELEPYRQFVRSGDWDLVVNHCLQIWSTDAVLSEIGDYSWPSILVTHGLAIHNAVFENYYLEMPRYLSSYYKWIRVSNLSESLSCCRTLIEGRAWAGRGRPSCSEA
jgi:hypothetical protein